MRPKPCIFMCTLNRRGLDWQVASVRLHSAGKAELQTSSGEKSVSKVAARKNRSFRFVFEL